jgi:hypothetical protein
VLIDLRNIGTAYSAVMVKERNLKEVSLESMTTGIDVLVI